VIIYLKHKNIRKDKKDQVETNVKLTKEIVCCLQTHLDAHHWPLQKPDAPNHLKLFCAFQNEALLTSMISRTCKQTSLLFSWSTLLHPRPIQRNEKDQKKKKKSNFLYVLKTVIKFILPGLCCSCASLHFQSILPLR
jgi:hypothetical protein